VKRRGEPIENLLQLVREEAADSRKAAKWRSWRIGMLAIAIALYDMDPALLGKTTAPAVVSDARQAVLAWWNELAAEREER